MTVLLCLVFLFFNPSHAKLTNKTLQTKFSSCEANVSCPAIVAPLCVRVMKRNQTDAVKRSIHMVVVNKCEMQYMKCHQGVEAAVVPMKNCDSGHKKLPSKPIDLGKKRMKRRADPIPVTDYVDVNPNLISFKGRKTKYGKINSVDAKMRADVEIQTKNPVSMDDTDNDDIEVPNKNKDPSDIKVPNNNKDSSDIEVPIKNKETATPSNPREPNYPDNKDTEKPGPTKTPNSEDDDSHESVVVTAAPDSDDDDTEQTTVPSESMPPDNDSSTKSPNKQTTVPNESTDPDNDSSTKSPNSDAGSDFDSQMKKFDEDMTKFNNDFHKTFPSAKTGSGADRGNDDNDVKKLKHVVLHPEKAGEALQAFEDDMVDFEKDMKLFDHQLSVENPRLSYTEEAEVLKQDVDPSNDGGEEKEEDEGEEQSEEEQHSPENPDLVMPPPGGGVKSLVDNEYGQAADDEDNGGQVSSAEGKDGKAAATESNSNENGANDENNGEVIANDEKGDDEKSAAENSADDENNGEVVAAKGKGNDEKSAVEDFNSNENGADDEKGDGEKTAAEDANSNENGKTNEQVEKGLVDQYGADGLAADKDDDNLPQLTLGDWQDYTGDCPKQCPSRDVMICARCMHDVYRTFLSTCHLRMFACEQPDEKLQLVARTSCAASAPFLADLSDSVKRVSEASDDDAVLRFVYCRMKGLDGGKSPAAFKGTNAKCGIAAE